MVNGFYDGCDNPKKPAHLMYRLIFKRVELSPWFWSVNSSNVTGFEIQSGVLLYFLLPPTEPQAKRSSSGTILYRLSSLSILKNIQLSVTIKLSQLVLYRTNVLLSRHPLNIFLNCGNTNWFAKEKTDGKWFSHKPSANHLMFFSHTN